jgi:hypothetical protein
METKTLRRQRYAAAAKRVLDTDGPYKIGKYEGRIFAIMEGHGFCRVMHGMVHLTHEGRLLVPCHPAVCHPWVDGKYVYRRTLTIDPTVKKRLVAVGLNPSIRVLDATVFRVLSLARKHGPYGQIHLINLYAGATVWRETLRTFIDPFGTLNEDAWRQSLECEQADVLCAWGDGVDQELERRFARLVRSYRHPMVCTRRTKSGHPGGLGYWHNMGWLPYYGPARVIPS